MSAPNPDLPNIAADLFRVPAKSDFSQIGTSAHAPRILLLYGSLRPRSFSRLLTFEAQRLLDAMGAETRIYHPEGLPLPDGHPEEHPKVQELRDLAAWSEGMVWTSPERHGAMTGIMKAQIDWIPLAIGSVRPRRSISIVGLARRTPHTRSIKAPSSRTILAWGDCASRPDIVRSHTPAECRIIWCAPTDCFGACGPSASASLRPAATARRRPTSPAAKLSNSACCPSAVRIAAY